MNKILTDAEVKSIFMYCDNKNPNGSYADGVDILEFAHKLEAVIALRVQTKAALQERELCIEFVRSLNTMVADRLQDNRPLPK